MRRTSFFCAAILAAQTVQAAYGVQAPTGLVYYSGDRSVILHWDRSVDAEVTGYRVYRAERETGPFVRLNPSGLVTTPGYCDVTPAASNGRTNYYYVTSLVSGGIESSPSPALAAAALPFNSDEEFLEYLQHANFDYFWYLADPINGLIPDRTMPKAACSIAAVGFGLSAISIGIDHRWIQREAGAKRVLTTLRTFLNGPQGTNVSGMMGYRGWFYHFLNMNSGARAGGELSSIDTVLLLAGVLDARQYFDQDSPVERDIRETADALVNRVDWPWMSRGCGVVSMGWFPESGFIANNWVGYNEAMILYVLGLGVKSNALPGESWSLWTKGYTWETYYGQSYVPFGPLFGHQYSHCWIDFRRMTDAFMGSHNLDYFDNSRRATLAQRSYCIANPKHHAGYGEKVWGLTACDGPPGYSAHGAPPAQDDDGTIAPTAAGGSIVFTPEFSIPTLRHFYDRFRVQLWTPYGFRDAFNLNAHWFATDELGIDQGPIVLMIENHRTGAVWRRFMQNEIVRRGLQRAGFKAKAPLKTADSKP